MSATEPLKRDHKVLRQMLDVLEGELQAVPPALGALQQQCHALARFVDAHMQKEELIFAPYAHRFPEAVRQRMAGDHADEWMLLHELDMILSSKVRLPAGEIISRLGKLSEELRDHLDAEEQSVFPVIDRAEEGLVRRAETGDQKRGGPSR